MLTLLKMNFAVPSHRFALGRFQAKSGRSQMEKSLHLTPRALKFAAGLIKSLQLLAQSTRYILTNKINETI